MTSHDAVRRAIARAHEAKSPMKGEGERARAIAVASPVNASTRRRERGGTTTNGDRDDDLDVKTFGVRRGLGGAKGENDGRMALRKIDANARGRDANGRSRDGNVSEGKGRMKRYGDGQGGESANVDEKAVNFRAVESFDEMVNRLRLNARAMDGYAKTELEKIYEESLEARSLRAVLENVKDSELEMAHLEAERRDGWAKSLEEEMERKWTSKVAEAEAESARLRMDASAKDAALRRAEAEAKRLAFDLENAPRAQAMAEPVKLVDSSTQTSTVKTVEVEALEKALRQSQAQAENERRQGAKDLDLLNADLVAKDEAFKALRRELVDSNDRAHFYERCVKSADERANNAEATAHALREELTAVQDDVTKLSEQMLRNAEAAAQEKESIMSALAAAQARANEIEQIPTAHHLKLPDAWLNGEVPCSCESVRTAKRLSAALADATSRNAELQARITMLESDLQMRSVSDEERSLAAERRMSVAREAFASYVHESQKCSPAPTNYSTIDACRTNIKEPLTTPKQPQNQRQLVVREPKPLARVQEDDTDSDEFESPNRHRGSLPTPRLRARVAIRLKHGAALKHPPGPYKSATDDELRRRAKIMGLSTSPVSRNHH